MPKKNKLLEKKFSRREALSTAAKVGIGVIISGVVAGVGGYYVGSAVAPRPPKTVTTTKAVEKTVTKTVTSTAFMTASTTTSATTTTVTTFTPVPWPTTDEALERAIDGIKKLIAAGKVPKGTVIYILCEAGFQENAIKEMIKKFYELSGFDRSIFDIKTTSAPFTSLYDKYMAEATSKSGAYDIIWCITTFHADCVAAGLARPMDDFLKKYDPNNVILNSDPPHFREYQSMVGGRIYSFPSDGDVYMMMWRADILTHPDERENFKAQYGYDLPAPPKTWKEYYDVAEFTTRKAGDELAGKILEDDHYGLLEWRMKGYTYAWLFTRLCTLREDATRIYFDPDTMEPLINKPDVYQIMKEMKEIQKFMPPGSIGHAWAETNLSAFCEGRATLWVSWYGPGHQTIIPKACPKVAAGTEIDPHPIYKYDRHFMACGYSVFVSNYSKHPELAYLINQAIHSPTIAIVGVGVTPTTLDPYMKQHFTNPNFRHGIYLNWTCPAEKSAHALDSIAYSLERGFPELNIPGAGRYLEALEVNLTSYLSGGISAEHAMSQTYKRWEEITEDLGREKQKEYYATLMQYFKK